MSGYSQRQRFRMVIPAFPAFNVYSQTAKSTSALGPICVASVIDRMPGWDVEVIDENNYRKFGPRDKLGRPDHPTLQSIRPADVVGLYGGLSSTVPRLHELARLYRDLGAVTIAGGQHFVGDNIRVALENSVDFVILGEGEHAIRELLTVIREGGDPSGVAGIAFMRSGELVLTAERPPITDFDILPLPDFRLLRYAKVKVYPIGWIRGCGMNCEFCTVKGAPRAASPERVVAQIASLLETHGAREFFLVDDLFGYDRPETMKLCDMLAAYQESIGTGLRITVQIRLDYARDTGLLRAMRRAGIHAVCIGIESPIEEELKAMDKRLKPDDMVALARLYHKAGFLVHGMFIFGYPLPEGVTLDMPAEDRVRRYRRFIRKSRLDTIQVVLPVPLPGTAMTARLAAGHRIFPRSCIGWEYYDGNFPLFMPDEPLTPEEMQRATRRIMGRFYHFRNLFAIGGNVLIFPAMLFSLWNIRFGWRKWHRLWRNDLIRFGGWIVFRRWVANFRRSTFPEKLVHAKEGLGKLDGV
jgi:radical SAM superfamily enzyme YgiQ (UPF0313 family)